jgi:hypothetical protein
MNAWNYFHEKNPLDPTDLRALSPTVRQLQNSNFRKPPGLLLGPSNDVLLK